jgi:SAM-dependent methyltransferase
MAITANDVKFLIYAKKTGVSFEKALMLGRLQFYASAEDVSFYWKKYMREQNIPAGFSFEEKYSEPLFKFLGAKEVDSMDYSNYEGASILHDLNKPFPENLRQRFTAIVDGGTIEHVFNFPVAISNCMKALKPGGHYLAITPANNLMGHGLYQFSPDLYYRVFSEENGFRVIKMFLYAVHPDEKLSAWYEVSDPATVKNRVMMLNKTPSHLMIIAEKIREEEIFKRFPQQSDYDMTWKVAESIDTGKKIKQDSTMMFLYRKLVPKKLKSIARNIYDILNKEKVDTEDIGTVDPNHFKKFED